MTVFVLHIAVHTERSESGTVAVNIFSAETCNLFPKHDNCADRRSDEDTQVCCCCQLMPCIHHKLLCRCICDISAVVLAQCLCL